MTHTHNSFGCQKASKKSAAAYRKYVQLSHLFICSLWNTKNIYAFGIFNCAFKAIAYERASRDAREYVAKNGITWLCYGHCFIWMCHPNVN